MPNERPVWIHVAPLSVDKDTPEPVPTKIVVLFVSMQATPSLCKPEYVQLVPLLVDLYIPPESDPAKTIFPLHSNGLTPVLGKPVFTCAHWLPLSNDTNAPSYIVPAKMVVALAASVCGRITVQTIPSLEGDQYNPLFDNEKIPLPVAAKIFVPLAANP